MVAMMGRVADRFHKYQSARNLIGWLELTRKVTNADGVEIVYPSEFKNMTETIRIVKESGLEKRWQRGSFTNPDPEIRRQAVQEMKVALDLAVEFGTDMISCCPLINGHNYSFDVDYLKQWGWML